MPEQQQGAEGAPESQEEREVKEAAAAAEAAEATRLQQELHVWVCVCVCDKGGAGRMHFASEAVAFIAGLVVTKQAQGVDSYPLSTLFISLHACIHTG